MSKQKKEKKKISESLKIYYNTQDTDLLITHREKLSKTMRKINGKKYHNIQIQEDLLLHMIQL